MTACVYDPFSLLESITLELKLISCNRKDSRYTEKDAAIVVRQMLKVAAECHLHGFVHRDMKPEVCSKIIQFWLLLCSLAF